MFGLLIGFGTISLKWSGVINADSVVARAIGVHQALVLAGALVVAYLVLVQLSLNRLARRGAGVQDMIIVTVVTDMALIFGAVYIVTPPSEYARALILALFPVQFAQIYFGQRATFYSLMCVAVFYTSIVLAASDHGMLRGLAEYFWDLSIFMLGSLVFVLLQGHIADRLRRIILVFERAQEGDFSLEYDEALDRMPDAITIVGRAYNRMRGPRS